ncbi:Outer membrane protein TolC [Salinimicrobium catena]|uniref:Outer membrane protein TolC n=1 Tax=Salinimicrobium catena TaxID=390640 RepID=A0A1H5NVF1_9FLAO|nr:TolC family protein [Salinimicrobium catena]SDL61057.1 Outer membrane protein TolC [Salinimicrobium catena]SEF05344.1 Outer membrane protein TolC [Salinimicrobium catena]
MRFYLSLILLLQAFITTGQETGQQVLSYPEYLAYVKKYHPVVSQADLQLEMGEAELLRARGAFDPKLEVDYSRKEFKGTEYYDLLNSTFKIPTWYGLELKAGFEQNEGLYLNPERTVPPEGLFSAGISLSAAQGLIMDKRRAVLKSAKALREQTQAERDLMVSDVLFEASEAYLKWARLHRELEIYEGFVANARQRFQGISRSAATGEIAAIDTVEAGIALQDRLLQLEQTRVKLLKQKLQVSNFLWLENNVPVELQPTTVPEADFLQEYPNEMGAGEWMQEFSFEDHPKMQAMEAKLKALRVERRLKMNNLLPKVDLEYNFITPEPESINNYDTSNYKAGLKFSFPLFLRKERGELKLAKFKLEDASLELELSRREIENKIDGLLQELESYMEQISLSEQMVANYRELLRAEERKFSFGESSLFLINSRENKLIEARLKQNELLTKYLVARAELFRSLGVAPPIID